MSLTLKVMGNHVMYDHGAWFLRVIMSSLRTLWCLPSVKKQEHDFFSFSSMYNKTIITGILGFCDIQNNQGLGRVISLSFRLITPTPTLIILDITKNLIQLLFIIWNCININCIILSRGRNVKDLLKLLIRNAFVFRTKSKLYLNEGLQ